MPATMYVVARFRAKEGKEEALKNVLVALVAPTRRELGCYQYDLLQNPVDAHDFCFVERWENEKTLDQHLASEHIKKGREQFADLVAESPQVGRYVLV